MPRQVDDSRPVVIIDIDEASLQAVGQWPWSRVTMGKLLDKLHDHRVMALSMDILFSEYDNTSPKFIARHLNVTKKILNKPSWTYH